MEADGARGRGACLDGVEEPLVLVLHLRLLHHRRVRHLRELLDLGLELNGRVVLLGELVPAHETAAARHPPAARRGGGMLGGIYGLVLGGGARQHPSAWRRLVRVSMSSRYDFSLSRAFWMYLR